MTVTKDGFKNHVFKEALRTMTGKVVTYRDTTVDNLPLHKREKIQDDFREALGWSRQTFSRKKNGIKYLEPHEIEFIEKYFKNYKNQ